MNRFDVIVYTIRRRRGRRRPFEVRWRAVGRARSKSFITRALADSYRAELVRAARKGLEFDPQTGEPVLWAEPEPVTVTWYQHAAAYAAMKWPTLAAHSRASVAETLATVTPALTRAAPGRPPAAGLRTVLYRGLRSMRSMAATVRWFGSRGAAPTPTTGVWELRRAATWLPSAADSRSACSEAGNGMRGQSERTASPFCST